VLSCQYNEKGTSQVPDLLAEDQKGAPPKRGNLGKDGSHRKEEMADGPWIAATCTILMAKTVRPKRFLCASAPM
jgi:hypothetical protein